MKSLILQTHLSTELQSTANLELLNNFTPNNLNARHNNYLLSIPNNKKVISMDLEGYLPKIFENEAKHLKILKKFSNSYNDCELFYDCFSVNIFDRIYDFSQNQQAHYMILKPIQGFQTWIMNTLTAKKLLPPGGLLLTLESLETLAGVYYLPSHITDETTLLSYLEDNVSTLFKNELNHFEKNKKYWPKSLSIETFHEFFRVEHHSNLITLNTAA